MVTYTISELATQMLRAVEEDGSLRLNAAFGEVIRSDDNDDIGQARQCFIEILRELQKVPQ